MEDDLGPVEEIDPFFPIDSAIDDLHLSARAGNRAKNLLQPLPAIP